MSIIAGLCLKTRYVMQPKTTGHAKTEWIYWQEQQSHNFHVSVALWCLIQMAPHLHSTFQIWIRSLKPFPRYETENFHKNVFVFFFLPPSSSSFTHFAKIAITLACMLKSCWNSVHVLWVQRQIPVSILGYICSTVKELKAIFFQNQSYQAYRLNCFEEQVAKKWLRWYRLMPKF